MSEIKGQILGVVLVLGIFGAIGGVLVGAFTSLANKISGQISEADTVPPVTESVDNNVNEEVSLLTF